MKIEDYKYKGLTPNQEGDVIGYALILPGTVLENSTEIDDVCIHCTLNSEPLKDVATIKKLEDELYISPIIYSKYGNSLGEEKEWFTPVKLK